MTLTIRPATPADIDAILGLDSALPHGSPREGALRTCVAEGSAHIAFVDAEPAGYAVMTRHFFDRGFVDLLLVGTAFRRQGIARALMRYLETACPTDVIWTSTNQSNTPMQALLVSEGFTFSGSVEGIDDGDPELFFRKPVR